MSTKIEVEINSLSTITDEMKTSGEAFTETSLSEIDTRSTLSIVKNSVQVHQEASQVHLTFAQNQVRFANLVQKMGDSFVELDAEVARRYRAPL